MKYIYGQMETNEIDGTKKVKKNVLQDETDERNDIFCTRDFSMIFFFLVIPFSLIFPPTVSHYIAFRMERKVIVFILHFSAEQKGKHSY